MRHLLLAACVAAFSFAPATHAGLVALDVDAATLEAQFPSGSADHNKIEPEVLELAADEPADPALMDILPNSSVLARDLALLFPWAGPDVLSLNDDLMTQVDITVGAGRETDAGVPQSPSKTMDPEFLLLAHGSIPQFDRRDSVHFSVSASSIQGSRGDRAYGAAPPGLPVAASPMVGGPFLALLLGAAGAVLAALRLL